MGRLIAFLPFCLKVIVIRLTPRHTKALEIVSAQFFWLVGTVAFCYPESVMQFYAPIEATADGYVWAYWLMLLGAVHQITIILNGPASPFRTICVAISACVWTYGFTVSLFMLDQQNMVFITIVSGLAAFNLTWAWLRHLLEGHWRL